MDIFTKRSLFVVAAVSTAAKLILIWSGLTESNLIADDAYYYYRIAANIGMGEGSTFDGLSPTNG